MLLRASILLLLCTACTFAISVGRWSQEDPVGPRPMEREWHACSVVGDKFYVFGGRSGVTVLHNTMHVLDLGTTTPTWSRPATYGQIQPRAGHSMNRVDNKLFIFGGRSNLTLDSLKNEVAVYDAASEIIKVVETNGAAPAPRQSHSAVTYGSRIIVFGGFDGAKRLNDIHVFDTESNTWSQPAVSGTLPSPVEGHKAVVVGKKMYVFGGANGRVFETAVNVLDLETMEWSTLTVPGKPRAFHSADVIGNYVYLFGGNLERSKLNDVKIFDAANGVWLDKTPEGYPLSPRQFHCSAVHGQKIVYFGGSVSWTSEYNDVAFLDTAPEFNPNTSANEPFNVNALEELLLRISLNLRLENDTQNEVRGNEVLKQADITKTDDTLTKSLAEKIQKWLRVDMAYREYLAIPDTEYHDQEIQLAKADIESTRNEKLAQKQAIEKMVSEIELELEKLRLAKSAVPEIAQRRKEAENAYNRDEKQLKDKIAKLDTIIDKRDNKKKALSHLENQQNSLTSKVNELKELERSLEEAKAQAAIDEERFIRDLEAIRTLISELEKEIEALKDKIRKLQAEENGYEKELITIRQISNAAAESKKMLAEALKILNTYEESRTNIIAKLKNVEGSDNHQIATTTISESQCGVESMSDIDQRLKDYSDSIIEKQSKAKVARQIAENTLTEKLRDVAAARRKERETQDDYTKHKSKISSASGQMAEERKRHLTSLSRDLEAVSTKAMKEAHDIAYLDNEEQDLKKDISVLKKSTSDKLALLRSIQGEEVTAEQNVKDKERSLKTAYDNLVSSDQRYRVLGKKFELRLRDLSSAIKEYQSRNDNKLNAFNTLLRYVDEAEAEYYARIHALEAEVAELRSKLTPSAGATTTLSDAGANVAAAAAADES